MCAYRHSDFQFYMCAYRHKTYTRIGQNCIRGMSSTPSPLSHPLTSSHILSHPLTFRFLDHSSIHYCCGSSIVAWLWTHVFNPPPDAGADNFPPLILPTATTRAAAAAAAAAVEAGWFWLTVARPPLGGLRGGILSFFKAAMLRRYLNESLEILRGGLMPSTSNNWARGIR
jgi:hypothetical protein